MNPTAFEITVAVVLLALTVAFFEWIRRYMASASERRMMSMLLSAGVDPEIARQGDTETIMNEVRRRCRRCESEGLCERWLAGEEKGENVFCPNAQVFESLGRTTTTAP